MKRIYVIWGGVIGIDGVVTSAGLVTLQSQLKQFGPVKSYLQQSSYNCADDILRECAKGDVSIIIGYSGGSVMATRICNDPLFKRKQTINLLVNIDGSPSRNMQDVNTNVNSIINIYDPNAWVFGGGTTHGVWAHEIPVTYIRMDIPHLAFQFSPAVRKIIVDAVEAL
jgi:hypothetical protein